MGELFQGPGISGGLGPAGAPAATLRVKFWPEPKRNVSVPGDAGLQRRPGAGMCARPKRVLVIHTLWGVSYFVQFHMGTKRS